MPSHIGSVEILITKARFQPDIAVAVAEAIDMSINGANLVTTTALDARLAVLEARFEARLATLRSELKAEISEVKAELKAAIQEVKAELVRWVFLTMLGNVALSAGATAILNALQHLH